MKNTKAAPIFFYLLWVLFANSPSLAQSVTTLQTPADFRISRIRIFPGNKIYALSLSQYQILVFNLDGSISRAIDLLANRPSDARFYFFDFCVDKEGEIYVFAVWRDLPRQSRSGIFAYDSSGNFKKHVFLKKHVDGRKILVTAKNEFVILGLGVDFYSGTTDRLSIMHRYNQDGDYLGSFFEVEWQNYLSPGQKETVSNIYNNLRPLVDRLAIGIHEQRGLFGVVPGSHEVEFYDLNTFKQKHKLHLRPPPIQEVRVPPELSDKLGTMNAVNLEIGALQFSRDSIMADFDQVTRYDAPQGQVRSKIRATYRFDNPLPQSIQKVTAQDGTLVSHAGVASDLAYTFSSSGQQHKLTRIQ